jgi:hypothetical protein
MHTKRLTLQVKDADEGIVVAQFAQLNVVDHDGDVTLPGAFRKGAPVAVSPYAHASMRGSSAPVAKGTITEAGDFALAELQYNLKTHAGREAFETVRFMGDDQEWSYGYDIVDAEFGMHDGRRVQFLKDLDVFEISPVLRGAGVGTRTVSAKEAGTTYADDAEQVLAACEAFTSRSEALAALRAKDDRDIGAANRDRLQKTADGLRSVLTAIEGLVAPEPGDADAMKEQLRKEHRRWSLSQGTAPPKV